MTEFHETETAWQMVHHALRCEGNTAALDGVPRPWAVKAYLPLLGEDYVNKYVLPVLRTVDDEADLLLKKFSTTQQKNMTDQINWPYWHGLSEPEGAEQPEGEVDSLLDALTVFSRECSPLSYVNSTFLYPQTDQDEFIARIRTICLMTARVPERFYKVVGSGSESTMPFKVLDSIKREDESASSDIVKMFSELCRSDRRENLISHMNTLEENYGNGETVWNIFNGLTQPFFTLISNTRDLHDF